LELETQLETQLETHGSRRQFLHFLSATMGAGIGLMMLPSAVLAKGGHTLTGTRQPEAPNIPDTITYNCNLNTCNCLCSSCGAGQVPYYCTASGCTPFCTCQTFSTHGCHYTVVQGGC
jgi:hypothetical protein